MVEKDRVIDGDGRWLCNHRSECQSHEHENNRQYYEKYQRHHKQDKNTVLT